jgi:hypothetical protein
MVNFSMPIERKLAAIMFTDIAGYTEQMPKDEDKASEMEEETGKTFLGYPIPKAIVEAWEKVK